MKKVYLTLILAILVTFTYNNSIFAKTMKLVYDGTVHDYNALPIFLKVNDKDIVSEMPPIVFEDSSLVPAREVFEALGAKVDWNGEDRVVTISNNNIKISLKIDSRIAKVGDKVKIMALAPKIINDKTMIPVRFVSEELGLNVDWSESERLISIYEKPQDISIIGVKYNSDPKDIVKNVSFSESDYLKTVQFEIKSNSPIGKYSSFLLKDPYRIVIDFEDAVLNMESKQVDVNENGIVSIRVAQNSANPNKTRVVFDLEKELNSVIYLSEDKKSLIVNFNLDNTILDKSGTTNNAEQSNDKEEKYLVVLDAGHGGKDPGAMYNGLTEKNVNLSLAIRLKRLLQKAGVEVRMTRETDEFINLYDISKLANDLNADMLFSIHNNAMEDTSYDGTMTLYNPVETNDFTNKRFAEIVQHEMVTQLGMTDRNIRERPNLAILRTSNVPAVLVEVGFLTNKDDAQKLKSEAFLQKAAVAMRDAIIKALNEEHKK